jgi:hypothetical protein
VLARLSQSRDRGAIKDAENDTVTTTNHQLRPRSSLGQVVATSGVIQIMEDAGINPAALLRRHVSGDWGDIHPEDDGLNEEALETGARILSVYGTADDPTGCGSSPRPTAVNSPRGARSRGARRGAARRPDAQGARGSRG